VYSHLVICGGLTFETLKAIVKSFVHHDWTETKVGMVVINRSEHGSIDVTSGQKWDAIKRANIN